MRAVDPLSRELSRTRPVDWRRILGWVLIAGTVPIGCALWAIAAIWLPMVPQELGRTLTEGFLRTFLIGYVVSWVLASLAVSILVAMLVTARVSNSRGLPRAR